MARAKTVSLSFMAALYLCFLQGAAGATFDIQNNCTFTVWAAALPSGGKRLRSGQSWTVQVPTDANRTTSRFWGRTGCSFNSSGRGSCNTGDCGGLLNCKGSGTLATLFEYSLNVGNIDYYDISLVDGFNLPVSIIPSDSSCVRVACSRNITAVCPAELKVTDGCKSACAAFNAPQYCCTGDYSINCSATNYSKIFKGQCPQAYSYGLDVPSRTFTCPTGTDYKVVFCGGTAATTSSDGNKVGVNYGMGGNNLPPVDQVVTLMNKNNIGKMRIFIANNSTLKALANSGIDVIVGVGNVELEAISSNQDSANAWVNDNIAPFFPATNIKYIAVGNEVLSSSHYGDYLFPAMTNIQTAIQNANLQHSIKVSTTHASDVVNGYPPSQGAFRDDVNGTMRQILKFLSDNGAPLMANVYPYFSYISNTEAISLEYALFKSTSTVLQDGGRSYSNLFDAIVDTFLSAMEASGYPNVSIVITESGWPSAGAVAATVENAQAYNNNLMKHVLSSAGTPKRPATTIDTYIYSLFNENQKTGAETERHFGLFNANKTPAYPFDFLTYQNVPAPPGNLTAPPGSTNSTALPGNSTVSSRNLTGPHGSTNLTALSGNLTRPSGKTSSKILVPVLLGSAGGTALVAVLCLVFSRRIKHWKNCVRSTDTNLAARGDFGQVLFYYKVLRDSTGNFDRKNMLGKGGFGEVYKGRLPDGRVVAVKKLNGKQTSQAAEEFLTEVKLITSVRHRNLVRLLGCCTRGHKRLLVYEFMPNNSLDKHLFGEIRNALRIRNALSWENRLNIIVGTARGLAYLHEDSNVRIIHRDIKCANILLDDRFHPKIADFGLAKFFPEGQTHVSTRVGGTIGYTAPEYAVHGQLTEKADVYSYGIVVLEIVSGRKCVDAKLPAPLQLLLEWAWNQFQQDQVLDIVDSSLQGQYTREEALRVITIALLCTQGSWALRPAMSDVVSMLTNSSEIIAEPTRPAFIDASADRPANITPISDSATSAAAPPQRSHGSISVSLHPR